MFVFGSAGSGKTTAAIHFPGAYIVDTERGSDKAKYVELMKDNDALYLSTNDFDEVYAEVIQLATTKHDRKTLVIDPITTLYNDLLDKAEKKVGSEYGRHYGEAAKQWKRLYNLLMKLDMNIIITSHAKAVYNDKMQVTGQTFDAFKKMDYAFDLVINLDVRGKQRVGTVVKSRLNEFEQGEEFMFCYEEIKKRYTDGVLESEAKTVDLASPEQVDELNRLVNLMKDSDAIKAKMLKKEDCEDFDQLSSVYAKTCIDHLKKQIEGDK